MYISSRFRLPSVVHVVRSGEVLSHYDLEVMREIVKKVALRMLNEQAEFVPGGGHGSRCFHFHLRQLGSPGRIENRGHPCCG